MESIYTNTRIRVVNGWLEIERKNENMDTKSNTHIRLERISHLVKEGPFGDYDHNEEAINVWNIHIHVARFHGGKLVKHVITFTFRDESEAETFLIGINDKLY